MIHRTVSSTARAAVTTRYPYTPALARDYISEVLYASKDGYFNNTSKRILSPVEPINFNSLENESQYRNLVSDLYRSGTGTWTTPVELFHPHYSGAIANWAVQLALQNGENGLNFVEVGGGTGTCSMGILDFLKENHPKVYKASSYTIVELSEELSKLQRKRFAKSGHDQGIPCNVVQESGTTMDPSKWSFFRDRISKPVCVVALEVMDNMPHDKRRKFLNIPFR
jgi:SAM-dependent MidA family methyltransferase